MSIGSNRSLYHFILKTLGTFPQVGVTLIENVVSCIERSRKIVLILSDAFLQNNWCHFETHVALTQMVEHERWDAYCVSNMRHSSGTRSSWSNYQPSEVSRHQMWITWSKVAPLCPGTNQHTSMDNLRPCKTEITVLSMITIQQGQLDLKSKSYDSKHQHHVHHFIPKGRTSFGCG